MSDIIFCRTWYSIKPEKFFNPIISYENIKLMRNTWELRKDLQVAIPTNPDSEYKEFEREVKVFNPLKIPKVNLRFNLLCVFFL